MTTPDLADAAPAQGTPAGLLADLVRVLGMDGVAAPVRVSADGRTVATWFEIGGHPVATYFEAPAPGILDALTVLPGEPLPEDADTEAVLRWFEEQVPLGPAEWMTTYGVTVEREVALRTRMFMPATFSIANVDDAVGLAMHVCQRVADLAQASTDTATR